MPQEVPGGLCYSGLPGTRWVGQMKRGKGRRLGAGVCEPKRNSAEPAARDAGTGPGGRGAGRGARPGSRPGTHPSASRPGEARVWPPDPNACASCTRSKHGLSEAHPGGHARAPCGPALGAPPPREAAWLLINPPPHRPMRLWVPFIPRGLRTEWLSLMGRQFGS